MYCKVRSTLRVENCFSDTFSGNVAVHQGSFVSPLLLIMVLEVLFEELRTGCALELLHTDKFVIIPESVEELSQRYTI